jgi:hypothetical protein
LEINPNKREDLIRANNKLTYITGDTFTNQTIGDKLSGVFSKQAIKIVRTVEVM